MTNPCEQSGNIESIKTKVESQGTTLLEISKKCYKIERHDEKIEILQSAILSLDERERILHDGIVSVKSDIKNICENIAKINKNIDTITSAVNSLEVKHNIDTEQIATKEDVSRRIYDNNKTVGYIIGLLIAFFGVVVPVLMHVIQTKGR